LFLIPKYFFKYLASSVLRLVCRIFSSLVCEYLRGQVYKRLSHPPSTMVCYIYVTHYPHSPYKISICGYLGSETTFQNLDKLVDYKGIMYRTGFTLTFNLKVTAHLVTVKPYSFGQMQLIFLHA